MRRTVTVGAVALSTIANALGQTAPSRLFTADLDDPQQRTAAIAELARWEQGRRQAALAAARAQGWAIRGESGGRLFELFAMGDSGEPLYRITDNVNAAISTGADLIRDTPPYSVNGAGLIFGVWDGGSIRSTHQEFGGRVTVRDGASGFDHSTHVGGTIGAAGVNAAALGMAPGVTLWSYDWNSDTAEMTAAAATGPGQSDRIHLSNHSYGSIAGWDFGSYSGNTGEHWFGSFPTNREDDSFGRYDGGAAQWDAVVFAAQYFLPFKSAGNDRNDDAPPMGTTFYHLNGGWQMGTYDPATGPYDDGYDNGGFDTISTDGNAKNIMTVGAVNDAVSGGMRSPASGTMSTFSAWGPTDDGRIKPDIVANGVGLTSSTNTSDTSYGSSSGTSMSSPNAAGTAQLLVDLYGDRLPGQAMRASTLKGLIIHTADDLGNPGPDYSFGWGLMNAQAAADQIIAHADFPSANKIVESLLSTGAPAATFDFAWDGASPIRATLCWTDPAGGSVSGLDNPSPTLVNDLDLRILGPGGSPTYLPFTLNPATPASSATAGDNTRDNVEQVLIASPPGAGICSVRISHKGALSGGQQRFSLILSGQALDDLQVFPSGGLNSGGDPGGPFSPTALAYTLTNTGGASIDWTATHTEPWVTLPDAGGTLAPGASVDLMVSINAAANSLPAGPTPHTDTVVITNQASGVAQSRLVALSVFYNELAELFDVSDFDLDGQMVTFLPGGVPLAYTAWVEPAASFPTDPTGGATLPAADDTPSMVTLSGGAQVLLCGQSSATFHVSPNGNITLGSGDSAYQETLAGHFSLPRAAALFDDLDPTAGGTVSWRQLADRDAVTWQGVPQWGFTDSNDFQIELLFNGTVRMTWLQVGAQDGLVGLSSGHGVPTGYVETDFSSLPAPGPSGLVTR